MQSREKKLFGLTIAVVLVGLLIDRVYAPFAQRWSDSTDSLLQLESALNADETAADRAEEEAAARNRVVASIPRADDLTVGPSLLALLQKTARTSGVEFQSTGRLGMKEVDLDGLAEVWIPVEIRSVSYSRLVEFLKQLRESDGVVRITSLRLQLDAGQRLNVSLRFGALVRNEKLPEVL